MKILLKFYLVIFIKKILSEQTDVLRDFQYHNGSRMLLSFILNGKLIFYWQATSLEDPHNMKKEGKIFTCFKHKAQQPKLNACKL